MKEPGDILLVSCYEMGHQPLALASPLGLLRSSGFPAASLDVSVEGFDETRVARARFVGISVPMHTAMRLGLRAGERARRVNPAAHICFYGLYATLNSGTLLAGVADSVIGGEFEGPLLALVESLARGAEDATHGSQGPPPASANPRSAPVLAPIPGVATALSASGPFLAKVPFRPPDRTTLPGPGRYARLERDGRLTLAGYSETSRGCLHHCRHCPIPPVYGGRFFVMPREIVLADIAEQVGAGAGHITFGDPDLLNGPGHVMPILREMRRRFPDVTFDITTKVEHIIRHSDLFPELADLGCLFVVSAVESLSEMVLSRLDKGHTREDVVRAVAIVHGAGIALRPSLLPFTPWTTLDDTFELLEFVADSDLVEHVDPVYYSIRLLLPPGSLLLSDPTILPLLGPLDPEAFTFGWRHPDPRMDVLHGRIGRIVEEAAAAGEETALTFERVVRCAGEVAGSKDDSRRAGRVVLPADGSRAAGTAVHVASRKRPPRLTESWFC